MSNKCVQLTPAALQPIDVLPVSNSLAQNLKEWNHKMVTESDKETASQHAQVPTILFVIWCFTRLLPSKRDFHRVGGRDAKVLQMVFRSSSLKLVSKLDERNPGFPSDQAGLFEAIIRL